MAEATDTRGGPIGHPGSPGGSGAGAAGRNLLFLREEELRLAQDLLFFGYRDFTAGPDAILAEMGMGRAHHRVLHFLGRRPGLTVGELLSILGITKQSLSRVLTPLVQGGFVAQSPGRADRRQRLLSLTPEGEALERRLFERQRETITRAYREAGPVAVEGFRHVMRGLMGPEARRSLERLGGADRPSVRAVPPAASRPAPARPASPTRPATPDKTP
ncbi:MarR family winged helix-turn-helix transcriptional regulator [Muricoccus pecuniae]|uniref:DNA-binding MarR family transcriptional regulator n=1 Tax=Muricoccus pecuniae TaxID=693023 RepID=A0A840YH04_9PROT|nr:MarR family transcriptional regulator [Roseomonas pecuniae]MBB5693213.1 DNA-binding MarR family transcriptional regulator [Roseomonas pecuniae]